LYPLLPQPDDLEHDDRGATVPVAYIGALAAVDWLSANPDWTVRQLHL